MSKAILYLEDGAHFIGESLSSTGESAGEVVFNTAMTGYQEILTDPSYAGQIVVMTYPLIGNYGVNEDDVESDKIHVKGFVVKEFCRHHSNHRATQSLIEYLNENNIPAIEGMDTRALTRHLRLRGAMKCILSADDFDTASLARKIKKQPAMEGSDWVKEVTTKEKYIWGQGSRIKDRGRDTSDEIRTTKYKVAAIDCGIKYNILRILTDLGCEVHVFPADATVEEIDAIAPDGLFLSNGPGDPAAVSCVIDTVRQCVGKLPIFGICLGHQILGLALGGRTYKLKFGHHGANHPVKDLLDNRIGITSQNHGFCVDIKSLPSAEVEVIAINLNDQTLEGMRHKKYPILSFQHHPEAAPGPHDAQYLFKYFIEMMEKHKVAGRQ
ncbi:MAG: carbamoyl phosphate synthase small subunit [Omnitrophica WOR_2 bacterium RIFCSPLOWO2_12_FULL_50_9]|nr:MAG: carbamoyl phosphate synthase small subunit [Omnitrophica WOR_2 bacterium RIFCSPHIGHO2_02_FULL_50_17]OGX42686.1 MAG: carbamoyl phosphate synthase small subunit [Omnitrophica WOR_2 bacterium RIFCSPLOWO2_12_FULL_50_9]